MRRFFFLQNSPVDCFVKPKELTELGTGRSQFVRAGVQRVQPFVHGYRECNTPVQVKGGSLAQLSGVSPLNTCLLYTSIDRQDGYHDGTTKIMCFDRTAPTVTAGISGEPLHIEAKDDLSGVAGIQVNGLLFTTLDGGKLDIHFNEVETLKSYEKLVVRAYDCAGNFSEAVTLKNPYYGQATSKPTTVPTATPRPAAKPTQKPGNSGSGSGNGTSGSSQATSQPTRCV